ncbi:hypothetical protein AB1Y20_016296 [Prymnesium parvum]|uniref:Uncharacterized protein n=1 Tax=Prymnesium parvum TaxID=97485 RepID=A0AB34IFQ9_PRYPA
MASCRRTPPLPSRGSSPSLLFPVSSLPRRSRPHSAAAAASSWHGRWLDEPRGPPPLSRVPDAHPALLLAGRGVHRSLEAAHEELRARCRALASENGALRARARALEQAEEEMRARAERLGRQEGVLLEAQETYAQLRQQLEQAHEHSRALQHEIDTLKQKSNDRFSSLRSAVAHVLHACLDPLPRFAPRSSPIILSSPPLPADDRLSTTRQ